MKLLLLLCIVAVTVALDYDYDDYEYDERNTKPRNSRKRNEDNDYDDFDNVERNTNLRNSRRGNKDEDYDDYGYDQRSTKSRNSRRGNKDEDYDDGYDQRSRKKSKDVDEYDYYGEDEYDYEDDRKLAYDRKSDSYNDDYESQEERRSRNRNSHVDDEQEDYYDDYETPKKRRNRKRSRKSAVRSFRRYGRSGHDYNDYGEDNYGDRYDYDNDYDTLKDDREMDGYYNPQSVRRGGFGDYARMSRMMQRGSMAYAARSSKHKKPVTKFVPVVVKKKQKKKSKIISVTKGFYIPGGTQLYGKFNDLHSCQKACELSATCFQGDYNPWLKKCYGHGNITACTNKKTHDQLIHFSKVPCEVMETPRGLVTLGARAYKGVEMKGMDSLQKCIKKCANLGGGIAPTNTAASVASTPQICFAVDYDFESHKCFIHTNFAMCANFASAVTPSLLVKAPSNVNVLLCPLAMGK